MRSFIDGPKGIVMYRKISLVNGVALARNTTLLMLLELKLLMLLELNMTYVLLLFKFSSDSLSRSLFTKISCAKTTCMRIYKLTIKTFEVLSS